MNRMAKVLFILLLLHPFITNACSCIGENSVKKEVERSDVVFSGKVLSKNIFSVNDSNLPNGFLLHKAEYVILVSKLFKGKLLCDTIKVVTGVGKGDCGYEFLIGVEYIIYAYNSDKYFESGQKTDNFLQTDICSRTRKINKKEIKKIIKCLNITSKNIQDDYSDNSTQHIEPHFTSLGEYSNLPLQENKHAFSAHLIYQGVDDQPKKYKDKVMHLNNDSLIIKDTVPKLVFTFENATDSLVIIEFPSNWNSEFVTMPAYFLFRNVYPNEKLRVETFYPDEIDKNNDLIRNPVYVKLLAHQQLQFSGYVTSSELYKQSPNGFELFDKEITGVWRFQLEFYYSVVSSNKRIDARRLKRQLFKTSPVSIKYK